MQAAINISQYLELKAHEPALVLLDVREPHELALAHVEGALHIPMAEIPARLHELARTAPLVVMCHHGGRSMAVVNYLHKAGFTNAINLTGGIHAYAQAADPAIALY